MSTDVAKAKAFYSGLLGWSFEDTPAEFGGYVIVSSGDDEIAGMMARSPEMAAEAPDSWTVYLNPDARAAVDAPPGAGGVTMMGLQVIPGQDGGEPQGTMALLVDNAGAVVGCGNRASVRASPSARRTGRSCGSS